MVRFTRMAAVVVAALFMATTVNAQQDTSSSAQPAGSQQGQGSPAVKLDHHFLKQAAIDNQFEIQLSQLAQQRAQDQKVKDFAQMMVRDHTQASEQLKQVAQKKQVQLPTDLPELKKEEIQIFQSLQGSEFDQAYLGCMKVAHAKDVAAFQNKAQHAKDQDVKQFAAQTLPKLREHKQQVMAMTGGKDDDAQTAGSREHGEHGAAGTSGSSSGAAGSSSSDRDAASPAGGSGTGTSSSGSGSRETGSGTSTGAGTTGAGSK